MTTFKKRLRDLQDRMAPTFRKVKPYINAADRMATLAVHMQKVTPLGAMGLIARGVNALADAPSPPSATYGYGTPLSSGQLVKAITDAGGTVEARKPEEGPERFDCTVQGTTFTIDHSNLFGMIDKDLAEWVKQAIDRLLPSAVEVSRRESNGESKGYETRPYTLTQHDNKQGLEIAKATLPLIEDGRCILLDGKPGVGKTTLAQVIARESKLGRVVVLPNWLVGEAAEDMVLGSPGRASMRSFSWLSPGVLIVDDIDKVHISLSMIEAMRSAAKLVILTANNGHYDGVLDGALMRAGRVDEVFSIEPVELPRLHPFTQLTDVEWSEVSQWPVAYVNEVRKRLLNRAHDVRLEDLRTRLTRRTRSGTELL